MNPEATASRARGRLEAACVAAYRAFADEAVPTALRAPAHRHPASLLLSLTSVPLRHLSAEQLGSYAAWAMTTVGSPGDYRHFLPRILELASEQTDWLGLNPWLIAGKLIHGDWRRWQHPQQDAVRSWLDAGFR